MDPEVAKEHSKTQQDESWRQHLRAGDRVDAQDPCVSPALTATALLRANFLPPSNISCPGCSPPYSKWYNSTVLGVKFELNPTSGIRERMIHIGCVLMSFIVCA